MQSSSPNWKRPSEVLRKRLVRRSSGKGEIKKLKDELQSETKKVALSSVKKKRENPFACVNKEKKICQNLDLKVSTTRNTKVENNLFDILDQQKKPDIPNEFYQKKLNELSSKTTSTPEENDCEIKSSKSIENLQHFVPVDWCLKSKVRFISSKSFSWCQPLKTIEQSGGIRKFVSSTEQQEKTTTENVSNDSESDKIDFQSCCLVWMHPHISWLKVFPRIANQSKIGKPSVIIQNPESQKALLNDWTESFSSAFQMVRSGNCKYFYVCSHQFTVLFRSEPTPGVSSVLHALLTPSSRGLRQALKNDDVEFTMPLNALKSEESEDDEDIACVPPDQLSLREDESASKEDEKYESEEKNMDENEDIDHTTEGASSWLENLGIDKKKYKSLNPSKVMLQRDIYKLIDNRPESALLIEGTSVMALVNFLLNSRSCIPNTGELAGVPATILAPVTFKGATLKSLQVKQGSIRQQLQNGKFQEGYSIELQGPILPTNIQKLNKLFEKTQTEFSYSCSVQETTTPFNLTIPSKKLELANVIKDLEAETVSDMFTHMPFSENNNGRQALREITCKNGSYNYWT